MVTLEQDSYQVTEGVPMIEVCTEISRATQRTVVVFLRTVEGTAQGEMVHAVVIRYNNLIQPSLLLAVCDAMEGEAQVYRMQ